MEENLNQKLCDTANKLCELLSLYDMNVIDYIIDVVSSNGYAFVDDVEDLLEEGE